MFQDGTITTVFDSLPGDARGLPVPAEGGTGLGTLADTLSAALPAGGGAATAAEIFGAGSRLAEVSAAGPAHFDWALTGDLFYSLAVAVCLAGICLLVHYFRPYFSTVVNIFRGTLYIEKVLDEHNFIFETFRKLLILTGILVTGLLIVRYCDRAWGETIDGVLPWWGKLLPVPAVWIALGTVWIFQNLILRTAGWLTYSSYFTQDLIGLRNLGYGLVFILSLPLMFTVALADRTALPALSWLLGTVAGALLIFVLIRTYMLFIRQKISILYWFLYLCAVEILPVSFLVVIASRSL